jgi:hypothetical protein
MPRGLLTEGTFHLHIIYFNWSSNKHEQHSFFASDINAIQSLICGGWIQTLAFRTMIRLFHHWATMTLINKCSRKIC